MRQHEGCRTSIVVQEMDDRCASCGVKKPELGEITLASKMGWRLLRRTSDTRPGVPLVFEWFCPACAPKRKST